MAKIIPPLFCDGGTGVKFLAADRCRQAEFSNAPAKREAVACGLRTQSEKNGKKSDQDAWDLRFHLWSLGLRKFHPSSTR
jgi:hypothetical protein